MMISNTRGFVSNSQDFTLRLSEGSTIDDTYDFVTKKTEDTDDIIVISDSSCSSSPKHDERTKSTSNIKNKQKIDYQRLYSETSSESEGKKLVFPWRRLVRSEKNLSDKKYVSKTIQIDKTLCVSDDTTSSSDVSCDRISKNQIDNLKKSYNSPTLMFLERKVTDSKIKEKYNEKTKETNKAIPSNYAINNILSEQNKTPYNTPYKDSTGKIKLTKKDAHKILRNIKSTQVAHNSPKEKNETNVIIDESTDDVDDMLHPAISPRSNREIKNRNKSPDIIDTSQNNIIPDSQKDLSKLIKPSYFSTSLDTQRKEDLYRPLSERKKVQIAEWLMTNSVDSRNDSYSHVSESNRNSIDSGNNSLEKLELNYETPNNRERINKVQTDEKKTTIMNSDRDSSLTRQTALDEFLQKSKNNDSKFCTPNRPNPLPETHTIKEVSSAVNTLKNVGIDYTNILDKLYGNSWRDKANALLPRSEPRKTCIHPTNRHIQTERKPTIKKYDVSDSDPDESDLDEKNIRNRRRKIQKRKKQDSFINDESLSGSDIESIYHTALTNPKSSTSTTSKPMPVPTSVRRLQVICDSDTEDENDKSSNGSKNLPKKRLSFSNDESSNTSEFDPGDYVPPKDIQIKKVTVKNTVRTPQSSNITSKLEATTKNKSVKYRSFLASLSDVVPINNIHPNAKKYRINYKNNKEELCNELYKLYNEKVFDSKLPNDIMIEWNNRMRNTAGYCYNKRSIRSLSGIVKSSRIVLATKILDTPDRLRDTLIHEMCHAATWLINNVSDGHGTFWTAWANKAMKVFPELPPIRRCHDYKIKTKFTYKCTGCGYSIGRHSKSIDIEKKRCGHCYGKFELLINKTTKSGAVQVQHCSTSKKEPSGFALYVKQNYKSVKKEKNNMKHADVMKILGQQFSAIKIAKHVDVENSAGTSG